MNWGLLKRKVLLPFAPVVGEYSTTHPDDMGGAVLLVVGQACMNLSVLGSPIGFPLASRISHFSGTADPCLTTPEKLGAVMVPVVDSGERNPTKVHGTEMGGVVLDGILSRPSLSTVVTK